MKNYYNRNYTEIKEILFICVLISFNLVGDLEGRVMFNF